MIQPKPDRQVVAYIRLTREESLKTGLSAPAQRHDAKDYCKRQGLPEPEILEEPKGVGGDVPFKNRIVGRLLVERIAAGEIGHVVVRAQDRLTRDVELWASFSRLCRKHNTKLHEFSGELRTDSPGDRFASNVKAAAAQLEKEQTGDRVARAKKQLARVGRHTGGPAPYGYMTQATYRALLRQSGLSEDDARTKAELEYPLTNHLYVNEDEAETVREIFRLYVTERLGCRQICKTLESTRRSGLRWHPDKIRKIIHKAVYIGCIEHEGVKYQGKHEPLIDVKLWEEAQQICSGNRTIDGKNNASKQRRFALSGIIECGCGCKMRSGSQNQKDAYYVCRNRFNYGPETCDRPRVRISKVDAAFWSKLTELLQTPDLVERVYAAARKLEAESQATTRKRTTTSTLAKLEQDLQRWYARHDNAKGETEREAAWARILALTEQKKQLPTPASEPRKAPRSVSKQEVASYLSDLAKAARKAKDGGRGVVDALLAHHKLRVVLVDAHTIRVSLDLSPAGSTEHTVTLDGLAELRTDRITEWLKAEQAKDHCCEVCHKPLEITRRHSWMGLPTVHKKCIGGVLAKLRRSPAGGNYTGGEAAKRLGIGRTTLNRWIKGGKVTPLSTSATMCVFSKAAIDKLAKRLGR